MANVVEVRPRTLDLLDEGQWRGVYCLLTTKDAAVAMAKRYHGRYPFSGLGGTAGPKIERVRIVYDPDKLKDTALLVCYCASAGTKGLLSRRVPGKASVRIEILEWPVTNARDLDGMTITGPDRHSGPDGGPDGVHHWRVVQGQGAQQGKGIERITISTTYPVKSFSRAGLLQLYGHVNRSALHNLGAAKGTLRLQGARMTHSVGNSRVDVDYVFLGTGSEVPWNDMVWSQKGVWIVYNQTVFKYGLTTQKYTPTTSEKPTSVFVPMKQATDKDGKATLVAAGPEARKMFDTANYAHLDAMIFKTN